MSTTKNATMTLHNGTTIESQAYSCKSFREDTYKAYIAYVKAVESPSKAHEVAAFQAFKSIAEKFCIFDVDYYGDFVHRVTVYMESYSGMSGDNPAHKVKSISSFRGLFKNGVLMQLRDASLSVTMPKAPASLTKKPAKKAKKQPTAKEVKVMADELARAKALLVKMGVYAAD